ncbi:putative N-acetyltransferase YhbS [Polymorphobacter multimanifer]|uniref:Putative N-acetyltransferase YhbS n=1 Tax=Polymorphobacter multimanifer TaxID=1070431 RepID=A0A841L5L9_9SPHN|nr:N-acetyltransferase [Polymorphobacter multimanifer]MBB6227720.1 putative N-acetyltransferase YhbS [Polymorphobacter multimanifer]
MFELMTAQATDLPDIAALLDDRFGVSRHERTAYRLRDGVPAIPELCLVARDGDGLAGSVQCWPLMLDGEDGRWPLVLLGPVAVARRAEGLGLGSQLMTSVLALADAAGFFPQLLIGDAAYYGRFGFVAGAGLHWHLPGPVERERLLLRGDLKGLPAGGTLGPALAGSSRAAA